MPQAVLTLLIENSLIFSALSGCVWLVKAALGRRLSAALHYALWAVVVVKLLVPVSLTAQWSPYALWQNAQRPAAAQVANHAPLLDRDAAQVLDSVTQAGRSPGTPVTNRVPAVTTAVPPPAARKVPVDWAAAAVCAWLAGAAAFAASLALKAHRLKRKIGRGGAGEPPPWMAEELRRCKEELGIRRDVRLVLQRALAVPAVMGALKPMLVVPESLACGDAGRLRHVFLHELAHVKRRDLWAIWVLNALHAVYWFNPLVWLCIRLIHRDMEAACDGMVVETLGTDGRREYIRTILHFSGREGGPGAQAAMSLNDGCTRMRKRIRGMFLAKRTGRPVKILVAALACLMVFGGFTCGCQDTPERPVVIGKGDNKLEEKIARQSPSAQPTDLPRNGERVQRTFTSASGKAELTVDAEVVRDDSMAFPAVVVKPVKFSQQQADKIISALVGGLKFYDASQSATKEHIDAEILRLQKQLNETTDEKDKNKLNGRIKNLKNGRKDAPATEADRKPANKAFSREGAGSSARSEGIVGKFDRDGDTYTLFIQNSEDGRQSGAGLHKVGGDTQSKLSFAGEGNQPEEINIPCGDALAQAQNLLRDIGAELSLAQAFVVKFDESGVYGYQFVFTKEAGGLHFVYEGTPQGYGNTMEGELTEHPELYQEPWPYEQLSVTITDAGLADFSWQGPCEVEKTLSDNVAIQSFDETMRRFEQMIFIKNGAWDTYAKANAAKAAVTIDRITLGLDRVQSGDRYLLIPVWDFFGTVDYIGKDGKSLFGNKTEGFNYTSLQSLLTINAIDGSVIDRALGY